MSPSIVKPKFRRFEALDGINIDLREIEKKDLDGLSLWEMSKIWERSQVAFTMLAGDTVIATMGVLIDIYGQGSAWIQTSDKVEKYSLSFYKKVKQELEKIFTEFDCVRVQTAVLCENRQSARFVERLGFKREGIMRKSFHNRLDRFLYARVI